MYLLVGSLGKKYFTKQQPHKNKILLALSLIAPLHTFSNFKLSNKWSLFFSVLSYFQNEPLANNFPIAISVREVYKVYENVGISLSENLLGEH